jgi:hypothetical protein
MEYVIGKREKADEETLAGVITCGTVCRNLNGRNTVS